MVSDRRLISSDSPYEEPIGFSRAVRVGDQVLVAGTAPVWPDGQVDADVERQADRCIEIMLDALARPGPRPRTWRAPASTWSIPPTGKPWGARTAERSVPSDRPPRWSSWPASSIRVGRWRWRQRPSSSPRSALTDPGWWARLGVMARHIMDFDLPDRFATGTVGEPGDRTFFLQAVQGRRVVSVMLEKGAGVDPRGPRPRHRR